MAEPSKKVFIDTNVLLSQMNKDDVFNQQAGKFFYDLEKKKFKGVTSSINKTELLAAFKKTYSVANGKNPKPTVIEKFLQAFQKLIVSMGIEYVESDDVLQKSEKFFSRAYQIIYDSKAVKKSKKWKFISGYDAGVILMAQKTRADVIMTNDDGYLGIKLKTKINVKILRDVY